MTTTKAYIERSFSLTKESYEKPWILVYSHPFDDGIQNRIALANEWYAKGTTYNNLKVVEAEKDFQFLLEKILLRIENYPYAWELEGQKIDPIGYDFYSDEKRGQTTITKINVTASAYALIKQKLTILEDQVSPIVDVEEPYYVEGAFLTKIEVEFDKAGSLNVISIDYNNKAGVSLLSFMYEEDTSRYVALKRLDLSLLKVERNNRNVTIHLGQNIFAKRVTMVFSQDEGSYRPFLRKKAVTKTVVSLEESLKVVEENSFEARRIQAARWEEKE